MRMAHLKCEEVVVSEDDELEEDEEPQVKNEQTKKERPISF
jgi:hypothetical protein